MEYESKMPEWHRKRNVCLILFQSQVTLLEKTHLDKAEWAQEAESTRPGLTVTKP